MTEFLNEIQFQKPSRKIYDEQDLENFKSSECCQEIILFVKACMDEISGLKITAENYKVNEYIKKVENFMDFLGTLVDEYPPLQQPMRFGNKAFKNWQERVVIESDIFLRDLLPSELVRGCAHEELAPYIYESFGNEIRIDYGTGHELNIAVFFLCLFKLKLIDRTDFAAVVLRGFASYVRCMRILQSTYMLEPAGSHGVWGLDDYHCLTFVWGAAQLRSQSEILPSSIHNEDVLSQQKADYLYIESIAFIKQIKTGAPFYETSPMLNDISNLEDWHRVSQGLLRYFQGEVLSKLPVVQHLYFGKIISASWNPRVSESGERRPSLGHCPFEATPAPWASSS